MAQKKSTRPLTPRTLIEAQRLRLLQADAVVICVRAAIDSQAERPDEIRVGDALKVASDLVNAAVASLDSVNLNKM